MRTLIAAFGVVLLVVTAIMPLGCARHGEGGTFDKYGFSLEYPAGYKVDERGAYRTAEANCYSSGSVVLNKDGRSLCLLVWTADQETGVQPDEDDLGVELGGYISDFEEAFGESGGCMQVGEMVEDSCSGHKMLRCYYKVMWSGGETVNGESGVLYCSESQRSFMLCTRSSDKENEADAVDLFHVFSSSLVCH
jgi:hypothetical protein